MNFPFALALALSSKILVTPRRQLGKRCYTEAAVNTSLKTLEGEEVRLELTGARLYFSGLFNMESVCLPEFCTSSSILELSSWTKAGV